MMISPDELKQQISAALEQKSSLEWLSITEQAKAVFADQSIPTRKTEQWKYSPLTPLLTTPYFDAKAPSASVEREAAKACFAKVTDTHRIVFLDGKFQPALSDCSDLENQGVLTQFSNCNDDQREQINLHLGSVCQLNQHVFSAVNYNAIEDGILIQAPANTKLEQPIHIVYLSTEQAQPQFAQTTLLVLAESGTQLQLIEQFDSLTDQANNLHNHCCEMVIKPNAHVVHLRMQIEAESQCQINGLHIKLERDSHYEQHAINFGSQLKRNDITVNFDANNAYCRLNGVFLSKHKQHIDNHINLEHATAHCNSDTVYKGFITDESRAVFNGRIHIHKDAQKTEAHLNNKNLLLSNKAELDTKPELEIYADDVKCSHGASIGQLDEKSLFYFQSRGIDRATAEAMLCLGFVNEMVELFPNQQVQQLITERLAKFFNDVDKLKSLWSLES